MKLLPLLAFIATSILFPDPARSDVAIGEVSLDNWKATLPFYFRYNGKESPSFISTWQRTEQTSASPGGQLHRYTFIDPTTHLKVVADVRTFTDFDAIDWVLNFTNEGTADSPIDHRKRSAITLDPDLQKSYSGPPLPPGAHAPS